MLDITVVVINFVKRWGSFACLFSEPFWLTFYCCPDHAPTLDVLCFGFCWCHCFHSKTAQSSAKILYIFCTGFLNSQKSLVFTEDFFVLFVFLGVLLLSQFGVHWIAPICALSGSGPLALLDLRLSQCQQFYHPNVYFNMMPTFVLLLYHVFPCEHKAPTLSTYSRLIVRWKANCLQGYCKPSFTHKEGL